MTTEPSNAAGPLISIVTVVKDAEATIGRTLRSVAAVKAPDIEYIVVDGLSTDGTLGVVRTFGSVVDQLISERDSGIYDAMNKGAAAASGRFILFINGDDELVPDGFSQARLALATATEDVVSCVSEIAVDGQFAGYLRPRPVRLPFFNSMPHPSTFVRTRVMKDFRFREDLRIASDYDLFLRLLIARKRFRTIDVVTAIHHRGGGVSADRALSRREIDIVKRDRLGWAYPVVIAAHGLYRIAKRIVRPRQEPA
ncbi:MAG TPA: glycosyltransferase family 2 protein [Xanthobacteraceae bacterium]|nr:glycosyltransferase family 2 protein [Xanthobacteraceae bacterium]